jgi:hypothetical protein
MVIETQRSRAVWRDEVKVGPACRSGPVRRDFLFQVSHPNRLETSRGLVFPLDDRALEL